MRVKSQSPILVYADTSVYGGVYDDEFSAASTRFFNAVRRGAFQLVLSEIVHRELSFAPDPVQDLFKEMLPLALLSTVSEQAINLQQAYIREGIVTVKSLDDALHVALATVSGCDLIVSWNFKHIVHFQKIPLYNAVNTLNGYNTLMIYSPLEVIEDESQEF
jgi:predicted nucleic acid-binding protein